MSTVKEALATHEPFAVDALRSFAEEQLLAHYPPNQADNGYDRCAECRYTRHPCDTFDLAAAVLVLLPEAP